MTKGTLIAALTFALLCSTVTPATAAVTPNSCRYSFDGLYRDMPVGVTSTATIVPDARYPAPTEVVPGQSLRTAAGAASVELPAYLAPFGYAVGLLHAGRNSIPVQVWLAIAATNTKEGVQIVSMDVTASTTITVDPADDNRYISSTPWEYTTPAIPELAWTAVGGDVVFSQGPGVSIREPLPVGTGGAARTVTGSAVIKASFAGGVGIYLDCRPGRTTGIEFDFAGPTYEPVAAVPFDSKPGPRNMTCLSSVGRGVSGAAANFPAGFDRELDPLQAALSTSGAAAQYTLGTPYTLPATTLNAVLSPDTLATMASVPGLVLSGTSYPAEVWVTIAGANTAERTQTLRANASYVAGPGPVTLAVTLSPTSWTPTGAGPISFTLGLPVSDATLEDYAPYGSIVLRLGTEREPARLDCAPAAIRIADASIPWSDLGRTGSSGRYAFEPNLATPVFAGAYPPPPPPPPPTEDIPAPSGTVVVATPAPSATPKPAVKAPTGRVTSSRVTERRGTIALRLDCPAGGADCRGMITIASAKKIKVGKRSRILTMTRTAGYTIAAGKQRTAKLTLGKDARSALRRQRSINARVTLRTKAGLTTTRTLQIRRGS